MAKRKAMHTFVSFSLAAALCSGAAENCRTAQKVEVKVRGVHLCVVHQRKHPHAYNTMWKSASFASHERSDATLTQLKKLLRYPHDKHVERQTQEKEKTQHNTKQHKRGLLAVSFLIVGSSICSFDVFRRP